MITAHADVVGSLLRPPWLLAAQAGLRAGQITRPTYKSIEDRAVNEAVAQQEAAGLTVLTDEVIGDWQGERPNDLAVVAPLRRRRSLSPEEFVYLRGRTVQTPMVTLPSPGLFANFWSPERSRGAYACPETLELLQNKGIPAHVLQTEGAVRLYNELAEKQRVAGLFHSTC